MTSANEVLGYVLDCGIYDLLMLDDIKYDLYDIVTGLEDNGCLSLNAIFEEVFRCGINDLNNYLVAKVEDAYRENDKKILADLLKLNPEDDITYFCNCLDTSVSFIDDEKEDIYRTYFAEEIKEVESNMGFRFS